MKRKIKFGLLSFLTFICMFSVGFSAWSITGGSSSRETEGSIYVDTVERPEFVSIYIVEKLQYFGNGFVAGGNDLITTVIVDLDECKANLLSDEATSGKLAIDLVLSYIKSIDATSEDAIKLLTLATLSIEEKEGLVINGNVAYININNESTGKFSFNVKYTFDITDDHDKAMYFKEGSILLADDVFVVKCKISIEYNG